MEIKPVTQVEYLNRLEVKGITTINQRVRVQLKLSMEEYAVMDFIFNWNKKFTTNAKLMDYYRQTGYVAEEINILLKSMKDRGLLLWNGRIDVFPEWYAIFSTSGLDDQIWAIHKTGNKQLVRERLPKVLKKISFEDLKLKLENYLKWCDQTEKFKKNLSTWLDPNKEYWNDPIGPISKTNPQESQPKNQIRFKQQ